MLLSSPLVNVAWLSEQLDAANLVLLDASMAPPGQPTYAPVQVIPGARRFDFDKQVCDQNSALPHMMPAAEQFTEAAQALGINSDSTIVVYDHLGLFASPRAWWMFKSMGFDAVYVLDGGLPAWVLAGLPTLERYSPALTPGNFTARYSADYFVDKTQVFAALDNPAISILDARPSGRFAGTQAEPRPGLRSGHMPGAFSLPFTAVQSGGQLLGAQQLAELLGAPRPLICSCGSGVTACVLALAAVVAGFREVAVYDGSWSEWGDPQWQLPVVTESA
ncbi:MAG TPA: sulfurtransferase [Cellvibrionaceae bacterium]|nr:sulfurtransferase [Cellvibrionaceae bacterium]HMW47589.1 sulfurtransferase [Cellvibrionaceae bacterium]HMW73307.1 sulfurtransferase [Cellvibrionaceae bacterium]HMY37683.1 sulfurtransferase [Marinagarivorans sp.]HNG58838.1 sulfurtransferase [Cellvibrionaceae bacterium]